MKALFVSNDPTIFKTGSATRARMHTYAEAIGELHIVSPAGVNARTMQEGNLFVHPVHTPRLMRVFVLAWRAHAIIRKYNIEVVSAQDPFEQGRAALWAVYGTDAVLHVQVHTDFLSPWFIKTGNMRSPKIRMPALNRLRVRLADQILPSVAGVRVVSERIRDSLLARYGKRIPEPTVIPVFVDRTAPTRVPLPAHPFTFALICIGRLEPEKRIDDIFQALVLVRKHYPMVGLFIVGEGREHTRLKELVRSLGLEKCVIFLGERPNARALMRSAQAFIQASAYEGYGRTLIEAALARVPIITTDVGIVGEVFKGYEDVLAVPVADPTALSLAIVGLIEDNAVRQQLPLNAEMAALRHLDAQGDVPKRIADNLERTIIQSRSVKK